jgi:hypothetical protein
VLHAVTNEYVHAKNSRKMKTKVQGGLHIFGCFFDAIPWLFCPLPFECTYNYEKINDFGLLWSEEFCNLGYNTL